MCVHTLWFEQYIHIIDSAYFQPIQLLIHPTQDCGLSTVSDWASVSGEFELVGVVSGVSRGGVTWNNELLSETLLYTLQ